MFESPPEQIVYALPEGQQISIPDKIKHDPEVRFIQGIPDVQQFKDKKHRFVIIDDQASECGQEIVSLFTRLSHHFNVSTCLLTQNIFLSSPGFRTMSLNSHYIVLFKAPRSMDQGTCMARQVCPNNTRFFQESYADSCAEPHSYFLIDFTQKCPENALRGKKLKLTREPETANPELRAAIIAKSDPELIEAISEICHNYVNGNIQCDESHFDDLKKHKTTIRKLAQGKKGPITKLSGEAKNNSDYLSEINKKRDILLQKGGGFWDAVLLPLMNDLASHFLNKIVNGCVNCRVVK